MAVTHERRSRIDFKTGEVKPPRGRISRKCLNAICTNRIYASIGQILRRGQFCKECQDSSR